MGEIVYGQWLVGRLGQTTNLGVRSSNLFGRAIFPFKSMTYAGASAGFLRSKLVAYAYVAFLVARVASGFGFGVELTPPPFFFFCVLRSGGS